MGTYVVRLPDVGEGVAEAEIVEWHVAVGDSIGEDDLLVDVMTDKATVELPTPVAGTISRLAGDVGDVVATGSDLVWIETDDDSGDADEPESSDQPASSDQAGSSDQPGSSDQSGADDTEERVNADGLEPSEESEATPGPDEPPEPPQTSAAPETRASPGVTPADDVSPPLAAPAVRRRADSLGIDLADVDGTGPDGRVLHEDLDRHLEPRRSAAAPASARAAAPTGAESGDTPEADEVEAVKVVGLRRNIAKRMQESSRRIAHFTYVDEVDMTALERLRADVNERYDDERPRLSVLPFLMRAVVLAVGEYPQMNARFDDDEGVIERHRAVHLGIATQTPKGLMVPVIHHAEAGDVWTFAADVARLADEARAGTISLQDLHGSTITITSLGALGGIVTTPVINHPEVAVIGVNKIDIRPVWADGTWLPRSMMNLSSSFDHRVIDGWDAAVFIQHIRSLLESPALMFVE